MLISVTLIISAGAALGVAGGMYARQTLNQMGIKSSKIFERPFDGRKQFRVLAIGEDETGSKRSDVHGRSDTLIVVAVDLDKKDARAVSIPRDTRCVIPGRSRYDKINAAYAMGGIELSRQTAEQLLGVTIDYYMKTNIKGLRRTVDLLGGVEIDIEKNMRYRDRRGGLYIDLKKGYRHLDGEKALHYVRFRHDALGDISRIQRQQKFLRAVARRLTAPENLTRLPRVIPEIMANVETNMSGKDLLYLAKLSKSIQPDEVQMEMLPATPQMIDGVSYMVMDTSHSQIVVDRLLKFQAIGQIKPTVEVLNGSGVQGVALRVSEALTRAGYTVLATGNAPDYEREQSEIQVHTKDTRQALDIGILINCTRIKLIPEPSTTKADVTIIVGKDMTP